MTNPAESIEEQIFANIATTLGGIKANTTATLPSGSTAVYWYTPGEVARVDQFTRALFDGTTRIVYAVRDTSELEVSVADREFGKDAKELTVFILAGYRDERADNDPFTARPPRRGTIRHRMLQDLETALAVDPTRGGLAIWTEPGSPTKDFEEGVNGWILAELPVAVLYTHSIGTP